MGEIGKMTRRVQIMRGTKTKSGMGAPVISFAHYAYLWASREAVGESPEIYRANRLVVPTRYKYRAHKISGIDESHQLIDESVKYNILSVHEAGLFIEMLVEKITE